MKLHPTTIACALVVGCGLGGCTDESTEPTPSGDGGATCSPPLITCGEACVDTRYDPAHCGGCDQACGTDEVCSAGQCGFECLGGTTRCGDLCVDTQFHPEHCGSCNHPCDAEQVCSAGQCGLECVGGTTRCDDVCVDTAVDPAHCGGCSESCTFGEVCASGQCDLECPAGLFECEFGRCVDTTIHPAHCGSCNDPCASGEACVAGQCKALFPPWSCRAIVLAGLAAGDGVYTIDSDGAGPLTPYDAWCDMTTDGGGWTLLGTVSGSDADHWNTQFGYWSDPSPLGSVGAPWSDYKSQAWVDLDLSEAEIMVQRRYDNVVRAQVKLEHACLFGNQHFIELFETYDTTRCGLGNVTVITAAASAVGLASADYMEGSGVDALGGSDTNGWCWNGGDNSGNVFQGHTGWNQSTYTTCVAAGHLGYIGVFQSGSSQYTNADITGTNWLNGTDYTLTDISFFAR